jgi:hypothetical protein
MTPAQEYTSRFKQIEREIDSLGRLIGVGRLRISQQISISEMTPALDGESEMTGPSGKVFKVSRRSIPVIAASVRDIDGHPLLFPKTRRDLDGRMDLLDEAGIKAAIVAMSRLGAAAATTVPDDEPEAEPEAS